MTALNEGYVALPKRLGFIVFAAGLVTGGMYVSNVQSSIDRIDRAQAESRQRGDSLRVQVQDLQKQRGDLSERLTKVEEKMSQSVELLREIRADQRRTGFPANNRP